MATPAPPILNSDGRHCRTRHTEYANDCLCWKIAERADETIGMIRQNFHILTKPAPPLGYLQGHTRAVFVILQTICIRTLHRTARV
jgi:hypothetical protein